MEGPGPFAGLEAGLAGMNKQCRTKFGRFRLSLMRRLSSQERAERGLATCGDRGVQSPEFRCDNLTMSESRPQRCFPE